MAFSSLLPTQSVDQCISQPERPSCFRKASRSSQVTSLSWSAKMIQWRKRRNQETLQRTASRWSPPILDLRLLWANSEGPLHKRVLQCCRLHSSCDLGLPPSTAIWNCHVPSHLRLAFRHSAAAQRLSRWCLGFFWNWVLQNLAVDHHVRNLSAMAMAAMLEYHPCVFQHTLFKMKGNGWKWKLKGT